MSNLTTLGIDLAKNKFQLHGIDHAGKIVCKKRFGRESLARYMAKISPCLIGMEACGGSHYWARKFEALGHEVKLMSPQYVKPYVKTNKNDANDAEGICEAVTRPSMRFVSIKNVEQQDIQMIHRIRSRLISNKTALSNQMRGLLHEYGVVIPQGTASLGKRFLLVLEDKKNDLSERSRDVLYDLYSEYLELSEKVSVYDRKIEDLSKTDERCKRLLSEPGISPITATALVSSIGSGETFQEGRHLSAWLGLVPRQSSSGEKIRLLGISKRGDRYLRTLLIHGARSVVHASKRKTDRTSVWIQSLVSRCGYNKAVVAVANKNARIAWTLLSNQMNYIENYGFHNA